MKRFDVADAAFFDFRLTEAQREMMDGQHRYALASQVMPMPVCCDLWQRALQVCDDNHYMNTAIVPTVVQLAAPDDFAAALEEEAWLSRQSTFLSEPLLPVVGGFAVNLAAVACGEDCGCMEAGYLDCGCHYELPQLFSPYALMPIGDDQAKELLRVIRNEMPGRAFSPLLRLAQLANHGLEYCEGGSDDDPEWGSPEYSEMVDYLFEQAISELGWDKSDHDHLEPQQVAYELPYELVRPHQDQQSARIRAGVRIKSLFRRSPKERESELEKLFAFPLRL